MDWSEEGILQGSVLRSRFNEESLVDQPFELDAWSETQLELLEELCKGEGSEGRAHLPRLRVAGKEPSEAEGEALLVEAGDGMG